METWIKGWFATLTVVLTLATVILTFATFRVDSLFLKYGEVAADVRGVKVTNEFIKATVTKIEESVGGIKSDVEEIKETVGVIRKNVQKASFSIAPRGIMPGIFSAEGNRYMVFKGIAKAAKAFSTLPQSDPPGIPVSLVKASSGDDWILIYRPRLKK